MNKEINLALVAATQKIDAATVIDPVRLAVALCAAGVPVTHAAKQCGVGRQALHKKLNLIKSAEFTLFKDI